MRILMLTSDATVAVTDDEAEIVAAVPAGSPADVSSPTCWPMADVAVLAAGQDAVARGFDAVCVGDAADFGANALRSVLTVPVIAGGRSAMLYALTLGGRFAILSRNGLAHRMKKQVQEFGLAAQCAGVAAVGEGAGDDDLLGMARTAEAVDGADTIVLAGTFSAADVAALRADLGRPVIEPAPLAVKLALGFLGLGLTHSSRTFPAPQVPKPELVAALAQARTSS